MLSANFGALAANALKPEMTLLSQKWGDKPVILQQAFVPFHFLFDDSLAAREVAACLLSQGCNGLACAPKIGSPSAVNYSSALVIILEVASVG